MLEVSRMWCHTAHVIVYPRLQRHYQSSQCRWVDGSSHLIAICKSTKTERQRPRGARAEGFSLEVWARDRKWVLAGPEVESLKPRRLPALIRAQSVILSSEAEPMSGDLVVLYTENTHTHTLLYKLILLQPGSGSNRLYLPPLGPWLFCLLGTLGPTRLFCSQSTPQSVWPQNNKCHIFGRFCQSHLANHVITSGRRPRVCVCVSVCVVARGTGCTGETSWRFSAEAHRVYTTY